jgi:hypothetical protein
LPIPWFPIYVEQDNRCNQTLNFVDGDISESLQYDFSGGVAGGQAAYANAYRSNIGNSRNERNAQWFARWSVQYLTCDGTGQSELAGGCANCGDRSTLEPFV